MQSHIRFFIALILTLLFTVQAVSADGISSQELIENGKSYDKMQVAYEGEVIGDIMRRGDYAWVNVNDGSNAMGIWVNYADAMKISHTGTYKFTGDIVRIQGVFNRACAEHGGDMDIHASSLEIIKPGIARIYKIPAYRILLSIGFSILSLLLYILYKASIKVSNNKKHS